MTVAPYGSWRSPVTLERLVADVVRLLHPLPDGADVYWIEGRPSEGGRQQVVRWREGEAVDVLPADWSARTRVHEYGGIPYAVHDGTVYFCNDADQRLYRLAPGGEPEPITPDPPRPRSVRFAAPAVTGDGAYLYSVRETHLDPDLPTTVRNDLVVVASDGLSEPRVVAEDHDFFGRPTLSPDGRRLAWLTWDHPNMPWDGTELWEAELGADRMPERVRLVAGGRTESVGQAAYSPSGVLHFVSDRTGWWNLYADEPEPEGSEPGGRALAPMQADLGVAEWVFGRSPYAFAGETIVGVWSDRGLGRLGILRPGSDHFEELGFGYTAYDYLVAVPGSPAVLGVAGTPTEALAVVRITLEPGAGSGGAEVEVLAGGAGDAEDPAFVSVPEPIEFPTGNGETAHALWYPPTNGDFEAPQGERPPLMVRVHGGPTGAAVPVLSAEIQFWTSRGIGVLDVNYRGSAGFGRAYRDSLQRGWGVLDVEDCLNGARFVAESGRADPARLVIHGGSAGGYTVLRAVTLGDVFAAGASLYGVADAAALARETHKFESRYGDGLIAPYPEGEAIYRERSPLFHTDRLRTPVILFQGLEDRVVPPGQSEEMAAALRRNGVPFAYVAFAGEAHGFRGAATVMRVAEAELYFFGRVLGFSPADSLEPVEIENAERLGDPPA